MDSFDCTTNISAVPSDIIRAHILSRLDGPDLAAVSSASPELHSLSSDESLWKDICAATWPSIAADDRLTRLISQFPSGHRFFFSDSFPILETSEKFNPTFTTESPGLISAVDIFYKDQPIFSKVVETETVTDWFLSSPFLIDLLDPKDSAATSISRAVGESDGAWLLRLQENLTLSWIAVDPTRRRAGNLSSWFPVAAQRHWLTGEVQLRFATAMAATEGGHVQCAVVVTCGGGEGEVMHVREVGMHVEDLEGRHLSGGESLTVIGNCLCGGRRRRVAAEEVRERFGVYLEMKREMRERKVRREKVLDMACVVTGISVFATFWSFILFR